MNTEEEIKAAQDKFRIYNEVFLDTWEYPYADGDTDIYQITPKPGHKYVRCHHVLRGIHIGQGDGYEFWYTPEYPGVPRKKLLA